MATDASDNFLGRVRFNEQGIIVEEIPTPIPQNLLSVHIFLKELFACSWAVKYFLRHHPQGSYRFHVAIDSSAAAAALRNIYSSNLIACHELDSLWELLAETGSSLHICSVRSEDNASDMASRNFDRRLMDSGQRARASDNGRAGPDITRRCWEEIQAQRTGYRLGGHRDEFSLTGDGIRHGELTDDSVSPETLWEGLEELFL